jgi:hypothetical protein
MHAWAVYGSDGAELFCAVRSTGRLQVVSIADEPRDDPHRRGAILALVFTPWRTARVVARPPLRVRYFVLAGLLWFPALVGGGSLGRTLHDRLERIAPQAALMGTVATSMVSPAPPAWRIAIAVGAWLAGSVACGAVLVGLGGAILGALLRDRQTGRRLGAAASLFAPIFAFAVGIALSADVVRVHGRRDWLATALFAMRALWPMAGWGALAATGARRAARPMLPPAWCAVGFVVASIAVLRIASEAAALPLVLVNWLAQ